MERKFQIVDLSLGANKSHIGCTRKLKKRYLSSLHKDLTNYEDTMKIHQFGISTKHVSMYHEVSKEDAARNSNMKCKRIVLTILTNSSNITNRQEYHNLVTAMLVKFSGTHGQHTWNVANL